MLKNDSQSIQQLLVSEKKAEDKVSQARKRKTLRLKQAKEEAQLEIKQFHADKEAEFKEFEAKFAGSRAHNAAKIDLDTASAIKDMEFLVKENKDKVTAYLLDQVFSVLSEVHQNFRDN